MIGEFYTTIEISRRKTLEMPENTENNLNMYLGNAAEESAAFVV